MKDNVLEAFFSVNVSGTNVRTIIIEDISGLIVNDVTQKIENLAFKIKVICSDQLTIFFPCTVTLSRSTSLQTAILEQFNPRMHCALQSRPMELQYLRKLSESILPFLLPPNALRCRYVTRKQSCYEPSLHPNTCPS